MDGQDRQGLQATPELFPSPKQPYVVCGKLSEHNVQGG